jgi:hypothetical protein
VDPETVAVNCCVPLGASVAEVGLTLTDTEAGFVMVTLALALFVVSAALVAVTVWLPAPPGAV